MPENPKMIRRGRGVGLSKINRKGELSKREETEKKKKGRERERKKERREERKGCCAI